MATPGFDRCLARIVVRIIIYRNIGIQPLCKVTLIFFIQRQNIIFRMSCYENILSFIANDQIRSCLIGLRHDLQMRIFYDLIFIDTCISGMRYIEDIITSGVFLWKV